MPEAELYRRVGTLEGDVRVHDQQIKSVCDDVAEMREDLKETRRFRITVWITLAAALIATIGSIVAAVVATGGHS